MSQVSLLKQQQEAFLTGAAGTVPPMEVSEEPIVNVSKRKLSKSPRGRKE